MQGHGAFDYIGKPLYPDELLMRVQDALASAGKGDPGPKISKLNGNAESTANDDYVEGDGAAAGGDREAHCACGTHGHDRADSLVKRARARSSWRNGSMIEASTNAPFVAVSAGALPKDLAGGAKCSVTSRVLLPERYRGRVGSFNKPKAEPSSWTRLAT